MDYLRRAKNFLFGEPSDADLGPGTSQEAQEGPEGTGADEHVYRQGFKKAVKKEVVRPREPVLVDSGMHNQKVQGIEWYASRLRCDRDGDVAHEFLELDAPSGSDAGQQQQQQTVRPVHVQELRIQNGTVICK